jgi:FkbM family methyltransferase
MEPMETDQEKCRTSPGDVARIYQALLNRSPESPNLGVGQPAVEYTLSVALSDERKAVVERQIKEDLFAANELWVTKADIGYVVSYVADKVIGQAIRVSGRFEESDISGTLQLIAELGHPVRLSSFVDVGANIGTHALYALARAGFQRALCIEADANNFKLLRVNQILNDLDHRCINVLAAASHENGVAKLQLSPVNFGDHRVCAPSSPAVNVYGEDKWELRDVPRKRLDTILEDTGINPRNVGLVWIDTQGHDGHVLRGRRR